MTILRKDPQVLAQQLRASVDRSGKRPPATVGELVDLLAAQPCESDFVIGDCNTPENAPFLPDVTGGEPCWPCYARRILKAVAQ